MSEIAASWSEGTTKSNWEPRIVCFFCNWCTYMAADLAGTSRLKYEPNMRIVRVMCSGRIDPQFVFDAFVKGADGVMIGGCHAGDCHYQTGNYKMMRRFELVKRVLGEMGIEKERIRLEWISAAEADKLKRTVDTMVSDLKRLGPLHLQVPDEVFANGEPGESVDREVNAS